MNNKQIIDEFSKITEIDQVPGVTVNIAGQISTTAPGGYYYIINVPAFGVDSGIRAEPEHDLDNPRVFGEITFYFGPTVIARKARSISLKWTGRVVDQYMRIAIDRCNLRPFTIA